MKAGKIIESSGKSVENKSYPGLFDCVLEHKVSETGATFNWSGPKITPAMWSEILAFFQWTYKEHKSEAQVRLFVHPEKGWMAWAFPQKGGTSLATKEEDNEDSKKQRAEQIPEGYVAFGTVHHHCSISAFQSSTDTDDEKAVDGLHITVGSMDKEQFTIHSRLYIKGNKFEPDMSAFWDIGKEFIDKILFVAELGFSITELVDKTARKQMCVPAPIETQFPKMWHDNYIIEKPVVTTYGGRYEWQDKQKGSNIVTPTTGHNTPGTEVKTDAGDDETMTVIKRTKKEKQNMTIMDVFDDIIVMAGLNHTTDWELTRVIEFLGNDSEFKLIQAIFDALHHTRYQLVDLFDEHERREAEEEAEEAAEEARKELAAEKNGVPSNGGYGYGYGLGAGYGNQHGHMGD
jgi:hypothetical protein